jgi:hypothetical protein
MIEPRIKTQLRELKLGNNNNFKNSVDSYVTVSVRNLMDRELTIDKKIG